MFLRTTSAHMMDLPCLFAWWSACMGMAVYQHALVLVCRSCYIRSVIAGHMYAMLGSPFFRTFLPSLKSHVAAFQLSLLVFPPPFSLFNFPHECQPPPTPPPKNIQTHNIRTTWDPAVFATCVLCWHTCVLCTYVLTNNWKNMFWKTTLVCVDTLDACGQHNLAGN